MSFSFLTCLLINCINVVWNFMTSVYVQLLQLNRVCWVLLLLLSGCTRSIYWLVIQIIDRPQRGVGPWIHACTCEEGREGETWKENYYLPWFVLLCCFWTDLWTRVNGWSASPVFGSLFLSSRGSAKPVWSVCFFPVRFPNLSLVFFIKWVKKLCWDKLFMSEVYSSDSERSSESELNSESCNKMNSWIWFLSSFTLKKQLQRFFWCFFVVVCLFCG